MKKAWIKWVKIVKIAVAVQVSIFLFVVYYLIILPLSFFVKVFGRNSLRGHSYNSKEGSFWSTRSKIKQVLGSARAQ